MQNIAQELRNDAAGLAFLPYAVEPRPEPVERAEQREAQPLLLAVAVVLLPIRPASLARWE